MVRADRHGFGCPMTNIFICLDGTPNATEVAPDRATATNVLLFTRVLLKSNQSRIPHVALYIRGVGTDRSAGRPRARLSEWSAAAARATDR
jgi:uncharacterized protein (DUF2235 family)